MCRFESSMPSQPVRSPLCDFRVCENRRHSRGLGWRALVSGWQILEFRLWTGGFAAAVSARHFPISVSAYPRPVRYVTETGLRSRFRACTAAKVERCIDCPVRGEARRSEAGSPKPGLSSWPASATTTIYASGTGTRTVLFHSRAQGRCRGRSRHCLGRPAPRQNSVAPLKP
jgi:hypothetical protein